MSDSADKLLPSSSVSQPEIELRRLAHFAQWLRGWAESETDRGNAANAQTFDHIAAMLESLAQPVREPTYDEMVSARDTLNLRIAEIELLDSFGTPVQPAREYDEHQDYDAGVGRRLHAP